MKYEQIYVTSDINVGGQRYTAGYAYTVTGEQAKEIKDAGRGETINLPTLDSIYQTADAVADAYAKKRKELRESPRYDTNEAERTYQLELLEQETAHKIAEHDFNLRAEIEALKIDAASKALAPVGTPEEVADARGTVDAIVTQLLITNNPSDVYRLLEMKVTTMNAAEKVEALKRFSEIKARASANDEPALKRIESILRTVESENEHLKTLRHIAALEKGTLHSSVQYHHIKTAQQAGGRK